MRQQSSCLWLFAGSVRKLKDKLSRKPCKHQYKLVRIGQRNVWSTFLHTFLCPSDTNAPFCSRDKADQSHVNSVLMLFETMECCRLGKQQLLRAIALRSQPCHAQGCSSEESYEQMRTI